MNRAEAQEPKRIKVDGIASWWCGDPRVEQFMHKFRKELHSQMPECTQERVALYNRAYEAVYDAIVRYNGKQEVLNDYVPARGE